ncbi:IS3 family transposase [Microbulbifer agarilyticus]|uniref:IS3 family transposase n=1 Tax=Microbulbifer agarilyticus TaxID=260552 RepID=UPI001CD5FAC2|nr:IS3 family transposase [Microbulbifer agarilyticus]
MSKSGFYAWRKREDSEHRRHDRRLTDAIVELHQGFRKAYGARRVHQQLKRSGLSCSVRRVSRLMKSAGIKGSSSGLYIPF